MSRRARGTLLVVGASLAAHAAGAQGVYDTNVRTAPQYVHYTIDAPIGETISELAVPLFAVVPVSPALTFDIGSAFAMTHVDLPNGKSSEVSGLTDTQLRGSYTFGNDFVVLTAGVNLPTGHSTVTLAQATAAARMGSDFLSLPITAMGTGFGITGGVAVAQPMGDWNVGGALGVRHSSGFDPIDDPQNGKLHFVPGNEYRARVGVDRPVGTGRFSLGVTFSSFGQDLSGTYAYNTGNRIVTQVSLTNTVGMGGLTVAAWNMYRAATTATDTTIDQSALGAADIANLFVGYGVRPGGVYVEPSLELRGMGQEFSLPSMMARVGLRSEFGSGRFRVSPAVAYALGGYGGRASASSKLPGFQGTLGVRLY